MGYRAHDPIEDTESYISQPDNAEEALVTEPTIR